MNAAWSKAYQRLQQILPWTLMLWFSLALILALVPDSLPTPAGANLMFGVWMGILIPVLVHTGARGFFTKLLPAFLIQHNHSDSSAH
jgi:hypothetical protein